jgi:hypothetical protein
MDMRPRLSPWRSARPVPGLALLLLLAVATVSAGQQGSGRTAAEDRDEVFAPFVSRLKATVEGPRVILTWRNPQGVPGARLVYRSSRPFSPDSFKDAVRIARLEPEATRYEDTPPRRGAYHYAVLVEDPGGQPYQMFIPFRNITSQEIVISAQPAEEELSATISGISARVEGDGVEIRFDTSRGGRELLLFRSGRPISSLPDLVDAAAPVSLDPGTTRYIDYPIPGIGYYYCVLDAGLFKLGKAEPAPGRNATALPVQVPLGVGRVGLPAVQSLRPVPLPFLLIQSAVDSGQQLAPPAPFRLPEPRGPLTAAVAAAVSWVLATAPPLAAASMSFQVLREDRPVEASGGAPAVGASRAAGGAGDIGERAAARMLSDVVNAELVSTNPAAAALAVEDFLRIQRPEEIEKRAHFYLGQLYYLAGRYRDAVLELLLARDSYYVQCARWLDACFRSLWSKDAPADQ